MPTTSKPPRPHKTIYLPFYTLICPSLTLPARKVQKVPILFYSFHRRILRIPVCNKTEGELTNQTNQNLGERGAETP